MIYRYKNIMMICRFYDNYVENMIWNYDNLSPNVTPIFI